MRKGITLITPAHANPIALKRTIDSAIGICDEIVVGDFFMFEEDRIRVQDYAPLYNLKIVKFAFNELYKNGFSCVLNELSFHAKNDIVLYLNVGEIVDVLWNIAYSEISDEYNAWYIDHATEKHRWWRCYDRRELRWSGRIHEELVGDFRPYHKPIFTFADTDKDMDDKFKAWVANDVKEMVYWKQLMTIVDDHSELGATNPGWLEFAKSQYASMKERMEIKGDRVSAFENGNFGLYNENIIHNRMIIDSPFVSTDSIEYQGSPKFLNKK